MIFKIVDYLSLRSTELFEDKLTELEKDIAIILCKLECIFPPSFFNCMEHLPIHLPHQLRFTGPVQYHWLYRFERFLGMLKKMVKNKERVEGSICEAYLTLETSCFFSYYFESDVPCMRNRSKRNADASDGDDFFPTLSIFGPQGRPSGKPSIRFLTENELEAAHLHVNCKEVETYIKIFKYEKRKESPCASDAELDTMISIEFPKWFKNNVHEHRVCDNDECHKYLCQIAVGPLHVVTTWPIYIVNGYKFHTDEWSKGKKTQNSGVCVLGTGEGEFASHFYGVLKEIVGLVYPGEPLKKCVLFNCLWFNPTINRGIRVHKDYGIVEVHHKRQYGRYDPFILASAATQVYYVPHPKKIRNKQDWWVVIKTKPRFRVDTQYTLNMTFQEERMSNMHGVVEHDEFIGNLNDDDGSCEAVDRHILFKSNQPINIDENKDEGDEDNEEDVEEMSEESDVDSSDEDVDIWQNNFKNDEDDNNGVEF